MTCQDLLDSEKINLQTLLSLNPWINAADLTSCTDNLFAGLTGEDERPVCIKTGGTPLPTATAPGTTSSSLSTSGTVTTSPTTTGTKTTSTSTSTSTSAGGGATPAAPTQTGIVAGCRKFYTAVSGDGCWAIANANGISLDSFYQWNPAVGTDCASLWLGYAYCIQGPATSRVMRRRVGKV